MGFWASIMVPASMSEMIGCSILALMGMVFHFLLYAGATLFSSRRCLPIH